MPVVKSIFNTRSFSSFIDDQTELVLDKYDDFFWILRFKQNNAYVVFPEGMILLDCEYISPRETTKTFLDYSHDCKYWILDFQKTYELRFRNGTKFIISDL